VFGNFLGDDKLIYIMFDEGPVTGNSEAIFYTTLVLCILTIPGLIVHLKYFLDPELEYETCVGTEFTAI